MEMCGGLCPTPFNNLSNGCIIYELQSHVLLYNQHNRLKLNADRLIGSELLCE